jgi:DNA transposition AAA+ family ATPase
MLPEQKTQIVAAAKEYLIEKGISANELAQKSKINAAYLSRIINGHITAIIGDKEIVIADKWFVKLADTIGLKVEKAYWETIPTKQFIEIIYSLEDAKENGKTATIIGQSGCGKTYAVDKFCTKHPQHTYKLTVSGMLNLTDIINELIDKLGLEERGSIAKRLARIIAKLQDIKRNGGKAIVIFDEAENLKLPVIKMLKALYDGVKEYCAIVLVGTDQLTDKLLQMKKRNKEAVPQFYRRFKAGIRNLSSIDNMFTPFYDKYDIEKGLRKLLNEECDNYGVLNDYLEPALREADRAGVELTEELFRTIYNMPKY